MPDNSLVFDDGCPATVRAEVTPLYLGPATATSTWVPRSRRRDWPPVTSRTLVRGVGEVRIHTFELQDAATVTATGYTLSSREPVFAVKSAQIASVSAGAWKSSIAPLGAGAPAVLPAPPGVFGPAAATPAVRARLPAGPHVVATYVSRRPLADPATAPGYRLSGSTALITWPDGSESAVDLLPANGRLGGDGGEGALTGPDAGA